MSFTPLTLDGQAAAARLLSWRTYTQHRCLEAVHRAFIFERSDSPGSYRVALDEWWRCPADRRRTDRTPPAGAICLWDLTVSGLGRTGHIAISVGDGKVATTDWPTRGRIGTATITEIERAWNATWLGWTNRIGGHTVTTKGDIMATLDDDDIARIRNAVWGITGGGDAPLIHNSRLDRGEYPVTILGHLEKRLRDEVIPAALSKLPAASVQIDYARLARELIRAVAE